METVRKSSKVTGTLIVMAVLTVIAYHWYLESDIDYFYMVKAFMRTKAGIGGFHSFLINLTFWIYVLVGVTNAVLDFKSGISIIPVFKVPVRIMCGLALLLIPDIGFNNIHLFWFICYILMVIGTWFSVRRSIKFCLENSNLSVVLKDRDTKPEVKINHIDFTVVMLLTIVLYVLMGLVVIGVLMFGVRNWELITGSDDIAPVVSSIRYDAAVDSMEAGEYAEAMVEFRKLEDYKDSRAKAARCEDLLYRYRLTYLEAVRLMNEGEYDEARSTFRRIYDYEDSAEKIDQCDDLQYGPQYDKAAALMENGLYEEALEILETMCAIGYMDTSEKIGQCKSNLIALLSGTWQGNAGSRLTLKEDWTCDFVDGGVPAGDGMWDVVNKQIIVLPSAFEYKLYGDLGDGYSSTSVIMKADSSSWRDEIFTKE